jgi:hypothetical protein
VDILGHFARLVQLDIISYQAAHSLVKHATSVFLIATLVAQMELLALPVQLDILPMIA